MDTGVYSSDYGLSAGVGFETLEIAGVAAAGIFIVPVLSTYSLAGAELVG